MLVSAVELVAVNIDFNKIKNLYHVNPINIIPALYYSELIKEEIEDEVSNTLGNIIKRGENYGASFLKELRNSVILYNEILNSFKNDAP